MNALILFTTKQRSFGLCVVATTSWPFISFKCYDSKANEEINDTKLSWCKCDDPICPGVKGGTVDG